MAKGLCQRCGLKYMLWELVFDGYFPNLRVCNGCYDPPQPQERLAIVSDPEALYKPAVDTMAVSPPILAGVLQGEDVLLTWYGFNRSLSGNPPGTPLNPALTDDPPGVGPFPVGGSGGANITQGYWVNRSPDGVNYTVIATLLNTADEFGALVVETNTYLDSPGPGNWWYTVTGFDVLATSEYGA